MYHSLEHMLAYEEGAPPQVARFRLLPTLRNMHVCSGHNEHLIFNTSRAKLTSLGTMQSAWCHRCTGISKAASLRVLQSVTSTTLAACGNPYVLGSIASFRYLQAERPTVNSSSRTAAVESHASNTSGLVREIYRGCKTYRTSGFASSSTKESSSSLYAPSLQSNSGIRVEKVRFSTTTRSPPQAQRYSSRYSSMLLPMPTDEGRVHAQYGISNSHNSMSCSSQKGPSSEQRIMLFTWIANHGHGLSSALK